MKRHRFSATVVVLAVTAAACTGPATQDPRPPTAAGAPVRVVGVATDLPGLGLYDGYSRSGFEVDLYEWLASHMTPQFHASPTPTSIADRGSALREGRVDLVVDVYSINDTRRRSVAFAGPYLITRQSAMTRAGDPPITRLDQLYGKHVCVPSESTSQDQLNSGPLKGKVFVSEQETSQKCVDQLLAGEVDVVSMDQLILFGFEARNRDKLRVVPEMTFGYEEKYGIGVPRENIAFCKQLVQGLRDFLISGQWVTDFQQEFGGGIDMGQFKPDPDKLDSCETPDDVLAGSTPDSN